MSEPVETTAPILPDRVEWRGPGGYVIVLDEDGVNLRPGKTALEAVELDRLLAIIDAARTAQRLGAVATPRAPGREPWAQHRRDRLARDAVRAVRARLCEACYETVARVASEVWAAMDQSGDRFELAAVEGLDVDEHRAVTVDA